MNPQSARIVLRDGLALLNYANVRWWISSGTLLGLVREQLSDLWLQRDTDWDIGIWGPEAACELRPLFLANGFEVHREYSLGGRPVQLCLSRDGIWFDLYFWRESTVERDLLICDCEHGQLIKPLRFIESRRMDANGFYLPHPPREYLFWRYGCNWHIPKSGKANWEAEAPHLRRGREIIPG